MIPQDIYVQYQKENNPVVHWRDNLMPFTCCEDYSPCQAGYRQCDDDGLTIHPCRRVLTVFFPHHCNASWKTCLCPSSTGNDAEFPLSVHWCQSQQEVGEQLRQATLKNKLNAQSLHIVEGQIRKKKQARANKSECELESISRLKWRVHRWTSRGMYVGMEFKTVGRLKRRARLHAGPPALLLWVHLLCCPLLAGCLVQT